MDFEFAAEEQAFAQEVEAFLDQHATPDVADVLGPKTGEVAGWVNLRIAAGHHLEGIGKNCLHRS